MEKVLKSVGAGSRGTSTPLAASVGSGPEGVGLGGVVPTERCWIPTGAVPRTDHQQQTVDIPQNADRGKRGPSTAPGEGRRQ